MQHLTDRRVTSCIHYASDVIEERTGWRIPVPRAPSSKEEYRKQLEEEKINLVPITEIEDSCLILYKSGKGYHVGVYIDDLNRVVHGSARGKSKASRISEMNRIYQVVAMYRVQGGQPGDFDENLPKAELFDPASIILVAITALAAGTLIKNWLDRDVDLPESEPENTRNLVGGQNQTRPDEALPWTAGRIRAYPDFSIPPYNRYVGRANDQGANNAPVQEWRAGLNFGVGRLRLEQLRLGDTDFLQFLAFDSPNSFDVVGDETERPPWWEGNVGGARARTETFSVFSELDYREPGFIQFTTGGGGGEAAFPSLTPGEIISDAELANLGVLGGITVQIPTGINPSIFAQQVISRNSDVFTGNVLDRAREIIAGGFDLSEESIANLTTQFRLDGFTAEEAVFGVQNAALVASAIARGVGPTQSGAVPGSNPTPGGGGGDDSGPGGGGGGRDGTTPDGDRP